MTTAASQRATSLLLAIAVFALCACAQPKCDLFKGHWIADNTRPYYNEQCPFLSGNTRCMSNGRQKDGYVRWSWFSSGCQKTIRMQPEKFLKMITGRTIAFVGDDITTVNLVPALLCELRRYTQVPQQPDRRVLPAKEGVQADPLIAYEYKLPQVGAKIVTIEDKFLMRSSKDAALFAQLNRHHHGGAVSQNHAVVDVTTVNPQWTALLDEWDVVVLQTGAAWKDLREGGTQMVVANDQWKAMLNMDNYAGHLYAMQHLNRYFEARKTAGKAKPLPYFLSSPTEHQPGGGNGVCGYPGHMLTENDVTQVAKVSPQLGMLLPRQEMAFPADSVMRFMDVTDLSAYRPEAHVGIYSAPGNNKPDCLMWCNPGMPDIWVDLLYERMAYEPLFNVAPGQDDPLPTVNRDPAQTENLPANVGPTPKQKVVVVPVTKQKVAPQAKQKAPKAQPKVPQYKAPQAKQPQQKRPQQKQQPQQQQQQLQDWDPVEEGLPLQGVPLQKVPVPQQYYPGKSQQQKPNSAVQYAPKLPYSQYNHPQYDKPVPTVTAPYRPDQSFNTPTVPVANNGQWSWNSQGVTPQNKGQSRQGYAHFGP